MEYVVSFLAFFIIYFSLNYLFSIIRRKFTAKESNSHNQKSNTKIKKSKDNKNNNLKQKDKSEFYRILKNSLMISFVYIIIILITKLIY